MGPRSTGVQSSTVFRAPFPLEVQGRGVAALENLIHCHPELSASAGPEGRPQTRDRASWRRGPAPPRISDYAHCWIRHETTDFDLQTELRAERSDMTPEEVRSTNKGFIRR